MVERVFGHEALDSCYSLYLRWTHVRLPWCWVTSRDVPCSPDSNYYCLAGDGSAWKFCDVVVDDRVCFDRYD
jgi:hypothetical protein